MFFRFGGAIVLTVLISLSGIALEKRILVLRRAVSHQAFRLDVLLEEHASLRLRTQQLGAPARLMKALERGDDKVSALLPKKSAEALQSARPAPLANRAVRRSW
jgi:hypothetical protein